MICIFVLSSFGSVNCQIKDKVSLRTLITELETRYNVRFSFADKTIDGISIAPTLGDLTLDEALKALSKSTGLNFKKLSKRFITISEKNNSSLENIQKLQEVVVTNYLTKGLSKTISGSVDFQRSAFEIFPGLIEPDVLQIAQKLPGILSVDEKISNINVRGGTNDQNLILFDGIRMYQSGHFFGLISGFNPYLTETLDISKNGTSAKYGDGVSSLFSIQTSDELSSSIKGSAGLNMISADGLIAVPISKKITLRVAARRSFTDVFKSATFDAYFDRIFRDSELNAINDASTQLNVDDAFLFHDINAKLIYDISATSKLRVNVLNLYNNLDYNQIFTSNTNENIEQRSSINQASLGVGVNYSKMWQNGLSTSIQAYFSNYDLDADNAKVTMGQKLIQENEVDDYGIRLDATKTFESFKFLAGYQFNEVGVSNLEEVTNPDFRSFIKEVIRTHALFSEVEWYSNSKSSFVRLGLRGNYFEKFSKLNIEPRLVINQKFFKDFRLEVIGELKSQSLTQIIDLQQDFFGIEKRRWQLADEENVPIINSQQVSLGLSYSKLGWVISAEAYYKNVDNITARSQGFQNQFQFIDDVGSYSVTGVDVLINKRFKHLSTWLGYTFSNNDYRFMRLNEGNSFANTLDVRHVANASVTYNTEHLKIGIGLNWHSGRPYTAVSEIQNPNNTTIEFDEPNEARLPSYFRTDFSALYNFKLSDKANAQIGASIWNVFNRTNIINRFYSLEGTNTIVQVDNRALEFTPNFSFRVNF
nr:FecR domain-containing protein [Winogradskyella sp. DF17]